MLLFQLVQTTLLSASLSAGGDLIHAAAAAERKFKCVRPAIYALSIQPDLGHICIITSHTRG